MVKAVDNGAAGAAVPLPNYTKRDLVAEDDGIQISELAAAAFTRLRRDLEAYDPTKPAIAYALAGETHAAILHTWREYPSGAQTALLTALLEEASGLLQQIQARAARVAPTNGYMYGQQEEAMKLEAQADITVEEIHRIEAELGVLGTGEALQ
jgi:hypothetical protein